MKLLIVSFSRLVSDARVLKQIELFAADYEVVTCGYGPAPQGVAQHLSIPDEHIYWQRSRAWTLLRQYRRAYWSSPAVRWARTALAGQDFDCVLADDIDTVGLALSLRPRYGVHADLHEYSPREKEDVPRWRWFVAPYMRWQVRHFVTQARSTTTVGQHIADEYRRHFGIDPAVVTNATPYADLAPTPVSAPLALVHSGAARDDRFLELMIAAVRRLEREVTFDLYLTPNDPAYLERLRAEVAGDARITIHDAVPYHQLVATLNKYDVGVHLLPPVNFNNRWALPNKFFDFVQARLALAIGPSPEMARLVHEHGLGVVAAEFTVEALTAALESLTPARVEAAKAASHAAAHALSAQATVQGWRRAIEALHS